MIKIAVNGFGRIGRPSLKVALAKKGVEVVAVNDLTDIKTAAHLFKYDSSYGVYSEKVLVDEQKEEIIVGRRRIKFFSEPDPSKLPWDKLKVDVVLECTGVFEDREKTEKHLKAGAKKVILSAPPKDNIPVYLLGVNEKNYRGEDVISNGSCTTNCLAPMLKVVDDLYILERGFMTTTHSYTNDQRILDLSHKDIRRSRAAAVNIIPTTTGAARTVGKVIKHLEGKLDGIALRVPTPIVSVVDFIGVVKKEISVEKVNFAFQQASQGILKGILAVSDKELVSMDFKGNPASAIVDLPLTMVSGNMLKIVGWYDNEWGYSNRLVELAMYISRKK